MTALDNALAALSDAAAAIAEIEGDAAAAAAAVDRATTAVNNAAEQQAADAATISDLTDQVASLQQQLADCEAGGGTPPVKVPRVGSAVNGPLLRTLGYKFVDVARVYLRNLPSGSTWTSIPNDGKAGNDLKFALDHLAPGGVLWLSYKETNKSLAAAYFDTMPQSVLDQFDVWGTYHHEPDNGDYANPADFVTEFRNHAPMLRNHGLTTLPILMRQTFVDNLVDRYWPGDAADLMGVDSYNIGNKNGKYGNVDNQFNPIKAKCDALGVDYAIGETGASIFGAPANRADWAGKVLTRMESDQARAVAWWDQDSYAFDAPTATVWMEGIPQQ